MWIWAYLHCWMPHFFSSLQSRGRVVKDCSCIYPIGPFYLWCRWETDAFGLMGKHCSEIHTVSTVERIRGKKKNCKVKSLLGLVSMSYPNWSLNTNCPVNTARDTDKRCFIMWRTQAHKACMQAAQSTRADSKRQAVRRQTNGRNSPHSVICTSTAL